MTAPTSTPADPHARHDAHRTPRQRQTAADIRREIASLERAIADPDWKLGCHPGMQRAHYRWQLTTMRRALGWDEAQVLEMAE